jgi:hypothetical protein
VGFGWVKQALAGVTEQDLQARSLVADDMGGTSESKGKSSEDVGGRSQDRDRRSNLLEVAFPTRRTRFR